jgi:hypothetical protein
MAQGQKYNAGMAIKQWQWPPMQWQQSMQVFGQRLNDHGLPIMSKNGRHFQWLAAKLLLWLVVIAVVHNQRKFLDERSTIVE